MNKLKFYIESKAKKLDAKRCSTHERSIYTKFLYFLSEKKTIKVLSLSYDGITNLSHITRHSLLYNEVISGEGKNVKKARPKI